MASKTNNLEKLAKAEKKHAAQRDADRLSAFDVSGPANGADWGVCDPERLQAVVERITRMDGAVIFGTSRDQGAHLVTLLLGDSSKKIWIGANEDLDEKLEAIYTTLDMID